MWAWECLNTIPKVPFLLLCTAKNVREIVDGWGRNWGGHENVWIPFKMGFFLLLYTAKKCDGKILKACQDNIVEH